VHHQTGHVVGGEQQVGPERHVVPAEAQGGAAQVVAGRQLAALVELAVRGQVALRCHAQHPAPVHDDGAVVHPVAVAQRCAHHHHGQQVDRGLDQRVERVSTASSTASCSNRSSIE
jgi:hypothetical protein